MSTENQIHLKGRYQREEGIAGGTISPGMLIEETSAAAQTYQAHSTAGGVAERIVAVEDALQGHTIDDDYSAGDLVSANVELPGNRCQMFLAAGENVAKEAKLESDGAGALQAVTTGTVIAIAKEAKDLSGSGAVATLIDVALV